jgi:hypothetical protein
MQTTMDSPPKPKLDISRRAHSLAREVDRLPPGHTYLIRVVKSDLESLNWEVEIVRNEFIRKMSLSRYIAE